MSSSAATRYRWLRQLFYESYDDAGKTGFPGRDNMIGKDTATIAAILRQHGYSTATPGTRAFRPRLGR